MIIHGDSLEELKHLANNSVDLVCTDPPYGYSFMGKDWDRAVPSVEIWKECLRVLKPGGFCFVMSAPRSDVQMHMISSLTEAGFRLDFTPIYWTYASGFPKAGNIGKLVDKRLGTYIEGEPTANARFHSGGDEGNYNHAKITREFTAQSDQAKALDGSYAGFQPKPAVEVIIVAMKPLSEKTFVDQALKNGKGITWLDDCRVPTEGLVPGGGKSKRGNGYVYGEGEAPTNAEPHNLGRFPANLLVSDDVLNDGRVTGEPLRTEKVHKGFWGAESTFTGVRGHGDSGSYSRYFDLDKWAQTLPFLIVPKASKSEKNKGLDGFERKPQAVMMTRANNTSGIPSKGMERFMTQPKANNHPTVKPLKLMSYLITLGSRPGDTVLDPFVGSGTTCLAAKKLNRLYIGIERELEYVEIAKARLSQEVQGTLL